jgi:hypothetical protein
MMEEGRWNIQEGVRDAVLRQFRVGRWCPIQKGATMGTEIPLDFVPFVPRMVAQRRFVTESDVVAKGLRLLQAREALSEEIRLGFER